MLIRNCNKTGDAGSLENTGQFLRLLEGGDEKAREIWELYLCHPERGINNTRRCFDPGHIVIGCEKP